MTWTHSFWNSWKGIIAISDRVINSWPPEKKTLERRAIEVDFPEEGERALWSKDESLSDED
jgi:hypothetical protein